MKSSLNSASNYIVWLGNLQPSVASRAAGAGRAASRSAATPTSPSSTWSAAPPSAMPMSARAPAACHVGRRDRDARARRGAV